MSVSSHFLPLSTLRVSQWQRSFLFLAMELSEDKNMSFPYNPQSNLNGKSLEMGTMSSGVGLKPQLLKNTGVRPKGLKHWVNAKTRLRGHHYFLITYFQADNGTFVVIENSEGRRADRSKFVPWFWHLLALWLSGLPSNLGQISSSVPKGDNTTTHLLGLLRGLNEIYEKPYPRLWHISAH